MGLKIPSLPDTPLWRVLKNRYFLVSVVFTIYMLFFDSNNWFNQQELRHRKEELLRDRAYFEKENEENRQQLEALLSSEGNLERFARENYFLKKPGEDVYVFIAEPEE